MHTLRVALITDQPGWHGKRLHQAFAAQNIKVIDLSLTQCGFDTQSVGGLFIPGFVDKLPDGVFVRGVPGGSFEQVTLRLGVLHALQASGVPVYNSARAIERTVDKAMTSFLLQRAGIPIPPTQVGELRERAEQYLKSVQSGASVIKPLFGSQGKGMQRLKPGDALPPGSQFNEVYYLQQFIHGEPCDAQGHTLGYRDWRVFVINGQARAAMLRHSDHWITNRAQGAICRAAVLDPLLKDLAEAAIQALDIDYGGVDIIRDQHGQAYVLEVNGIPAWQGLQTVCAQDLTKMLVDDFVSRYLSASKRACLIS